MDDCLIIGGGVIGLSLAYELSGRGWKVRVLDRDQPGRQASWAGAGILPPANLETANTPWEKLRGLSQKLHPIWAADLKEETGIDNGYRLCGGIHLACSSGEAAVLRGSMADLQEDQITAQSLTPQELVEIEPAMTNIVASGRLQASYLLPDEAQIRNPRYLKALIAACTLRGVKITGSTKVLAFQQTADRIESVKTTGGDFQAEKFCVTSGVWTGGLMRNLKIHLPMEPIRGQMVLLSCQEPIFNRVVNEGPRYLVPRDDGRVLVGSTEEEVGFDCRPTSDGTAELLDFALNLVPRLGSATIERTWAGLRPRTIDGYPYLGQIPGLKNGYLAAGHFRSGLHLSPGTATVMSRIIRGEAPQLDLTPFRLAAR